MDELPVNRFAAALGLPGTPKIKFLNKQKEPRKSLLTEDGSEDDSGSSEAPNENEAEGGSDEGRNVCFYSLSQPFTQTALGGESTNQI